MNDNNTKTAFSNIDNAPTKKKKRQRVSVVSESEEKDSRVQYEKDYIEGFAKKLFEKLDESSFSKVITTLQEYETHLLSPQELLDRLEILFNHNEDLKWEFLSFLEPYQTKDSGRIMEYFTISDIKEFICKLMLHFRKQPHWMKKIIDKLCYLTENEYLTRDILEKNIAPFLPKNSDLIQQFLKLFPLGRPQDRYFMGDDVWEEFIIDNEQIDEETLDSSHFNEVVNGERKSCIYGCKTNNKISTCVVCDIKYINGRMYIANGRILCPANIIFDSSDEKENMRRLCGKIDYYISSTSRPTKVHKRSDSQSKESEGGLSPSTLGTESEEEIGDHDISNRNKNKKRKTARGLKIRFKSNKKKRTENNFSSDQVQTDDTAPSNDDVSCDDTSKEDNDYNSCDESIFKRNEYSLSLPAKEIVALKDMELNISTGCTSSNRLGQENQKIAKN